MGLPRKKKVKPQAGTNFIARHFRLVQITYSFFGVGLLNHFAPVILLSGGNYLSAFSPTSCSCSCGGMGYVLSVTDRGRRHRPWSSPTVCHRPCRSCVFYIVPRFRLDECYTVAKGPRLYRSIIFQMNSIGISMSGCKLLCTAHVCAARSNFR